MMGNGTYDAWQDGRFTLDELPQIVHNKVWGDSWTPRSLYDLLGESGPVGSYAGWKDATIKALVPRFESAQQAADWLEGNGYVGQAFFKKFDVRLAQDIADSVAAHVDRFGSDLRFKYVGNNRELMKQIREAKRPGIEEFARRMFSPIVGEPITPEGEARREERIARYVKQAVSRSANLYRMPRNSYAYAMDEMFFVSQKYGSKYDDLIESLARDVRLGWHPVGCDTPRSVVDHEIGHIIRKKLFDSAADSELNRLYRIYVGADAAPSRYARVSASEFLAEAWAEFLNSSDPGEAARAIGELIERFEENK